MKFKQNRLFIKKSSIFITNLQNYLRTILFYLFRVFPINNNKIVVQCYRGMGYCDSPKYICEMLIQKKSECQIVWLTSSEYVNQFPKQITVIPINTFRAIKELVTAKIWIDNCRKDVYVRKRSKQFYLQTWHNGISLKRVEADVIDVLSKMYIASAQNDSRLINVFLSNSRFSTNRIKNSFWYSGKILEFGLPRNDILLNYINTKFVGDIKEKICSFFGLSKNSNLLIYAPTFRRDYSTEMYLENFDLITKELNKKSKQPRKILVHFHPNLILKNKKNISNTNNVIYTNWYPDFQEILLVADILITDYSSTMFEFSFMKKPVFLFMPDIEEYKQDRNFTFDINDLPWPISTTITDLIVNIDKFNYDDYLNRLNCFMDKLDIYEKGESSIKTTKYIEKILKGQQYEN